MNPGAVGQPRDGNPDASYAILDTTARTVQVRRVSYDVDATMAKIADAGLPAPLADRAHRGVTAPAALSPGASPSAARP